MVESLDNSVMLINRITALHVVFKACSENIHWFTQLTSLNPGILVHLDKSRATQDENMVCV